jgi:pyruvate/oxaloacetate carboxyltransferase|tara:strand:+ start:405 stop:620 length:216 start_codon:yes stop_codon:yes gene_type:complete
MKEINIDTSDKRSTFDRFCESIFYKYKEEKKANNEEDILSYSDYRTQYKMFLRQKYKDKKASDLKKKLGLD